MKLTVGPLPMVVYWRRRAMLLGGMLLAASMLWVSCATVSKSAPAAKESPRPTTVVSASGSAAGLLTPLTPGALDSLPSTTTESPTAPAVNPPPPGGSAAPAPACTDAEIQLTPVADQVTAKRGATLRFTLKIKNTSTHPCSRDLGADPQELYMEQGTAKIWSSDACNALHGTNMQTLAAGDEQAFYVQWKGKSNTAGCDEAKWKAPPIGKYQLIGRLATKISEPFVLTLT